MLADIIKKYRKQNKLSIRDFARLVGCSHTYIMMIERGEQYLPKSKILYNISKITNIPLETILKETYAEENGIYKTYLNKEELERRIK